MISMLMTSESFRLLSTTSRFLVLMKLSLTSVKHIQSLTTASSILLPVSMYVEFSQRTPACSQMASANRSSSPSTTAPTQITIQAFYNEWMKELSWEDDQRQYRFAKQILPRQDIFPKVPATLRLATSCVDGEPHNSWHQEVLTFLNGLKATGQLSDWNQVAFLSARSRTRKS